MSKIPVRQRRGACFVLSLLAHKGVVAGCAAGLLGFTGTALATPPSGFTSTTIGLATFDAIRVVNAGDARVKIETKADVDVHTLFNTFVPGGRIGWHKHPGPSLVTVISGTATFYHGDDPTCTPQLYPAGTGFIDSGDDIHDLHNEGSVNLEVVVVSIVPEGAPRRIDVPSPGNCPF